MMKCNAEDDGHMAFADDYRAMYKAALILATIAVAAPVLAQDAGIAPASEISDRELAQSAVGTAPYIPSPSSRAWWSRIPDGHLALGAGMTYQYDGSKGTDLVFASWRTRDDRYELAAFRFLTPQTRLGCDLADANWVFEASRRWTLHWNLIDRSGVELFIGGGAAYKNKTDDLNGSNWNFAEQLG
jgi:hypothetical protein